MGGILGGTMGLFEHAWIMWRGQFIELTLAENPTVEGYSVSTDDVRNAMLARNAWGAIYPERISKLMFRLAKK